jgi:putative tryptophan/tyrosine transport system substrate-binding protein
MIRRRSLVAALGCTVAAAPLAADPKQKAMPVVGILLAGSRSPYFSIAPDPLSEDPIRQGLREIGYIDGKNVAFEYRWDEGNNDRLPALAADLVSRGVDLIIVRSGTSGVLAAKSATSPIPIVFVNVGDPVAAGLVASLARPGGNITGFSSIATGLTPKLLDLLSELVPRAGAFALLVNPTNQNSARVISTVREAARAKGIRLSVQNASTEGEIDAVFASLVEVQAGALVINGDALFTSRIEQIVSLASRHAIATAYQLPTFAAADGLMSFGFDEDDARRQAGIYAGRILNGANPGDLPVQQPTTFKLVVNLKTAKALGLTVSQSVLARADEVIE